MTILTMTNAYGPRTGGVRTQIDALRRAYVAAGHRSVLLYPADAAAVEADECGPVWRLPGPRLPINPDYRNLWALGPLLRAVEQIAPDSIEIVDKWTLPRAAAPLRRRGWPVVGFSCERLDKVLAAYLPRPLRGAPVAAYNRWFGQQFDALICHSEFAADELRAVGARPRVVPLGVDPAPFRAAQADPAWRAARLGDGRHLLLYVGRLVPEKRLDRLVALMPLLAPRGVRLVVVGAGPLAPQFARLPGTSVEPFVRDRARLASLYASADVFVQTSDIEAFGLGVLEALAAGCRVVAARGGAAAEVLPAGFPTAGPRLDEWCEAIWSALALDREPAARVARARAARYPWSATARTLLAVHGELEQARG